LGELELHGDNLPQLGGCMTNVSSIKVEAALEETAEQVRAMSHGGPLIWTDICPIYLVCIQRADPLGWIDKRIVGAKGHD
jgi:hypothetical protein